MTADPITKKVQSAERTQTIESARFVAEMAVTTMGIETIPTNGYSNVAILGLMQSELRKVLDLRGDDSNLSYFVIISVTMGKRAGHPDVLVGADERLKSSNYFATIADGRSDACTKLFNTLRYDPLLAVDRQSEDWFAGK